MNADGCRILLLEDDPELGALTQEYLSEFGFTVALETNGLRGIGRVLSEEPGLVILDVMLPGEDGFNVCRQLRPRFAGPILMLTARSEVIDQVLGLELGADDYLTKPFEPRVLLARVRALLRRSELGAVTQKQLTNGSIETAGAAGLLRAGSVAIDDGERKAYVNGVAIELSDPEYRLLHLLVRNAGIILSRQDIFSALRRIDYDGQNRAVDVLISQLRAKLGDNPAAPRMIKTVRNRGYLFARYSCNKGSPDTFVAT